MEIEVIEDVLLSLLIYNVDNKGAWISCNLLKMRVGCSDEEFDNILEHLKKEKYIEFRDDEHLKITKKGIDFITSRV